MNLDDILFHLGEERENYFNAVCPPVIQTSNFAFRDVQHFRNSLADEFSNSVYTRGNNPTVAIARKKIAALEQTEDCLLFSSGSAAIAAAIMSQVETGDHIVCVQSPYSWTHKLLTLLLPRFGVTTTFVDGTSMASIRNAIKDNTKVLYLESPNSLTFELQDLEQCSKLAKENGMISIIDNTYCSPLYQQPSKFGIDLVVQSVTKYLNGHSDIMAGAICGSEPLIRKIFMSEYMTIGAILSPHDASLLIRGLRTLKLRVEQSDKSCKAITDWLADHPAVERLYYPFAKDNPQLELAKRQMTGTAGLFSVTLKADSIAAVEAFCNRLTRFLLAVSWGGHESLYLPICGLYGIEGRDEPPIPWNLVRFYIGIENTDGLKADLEQALKLLNA